MKIPFPSLAALLLLTTSCGTAWSQTSRAQAVAASPAADALAPTSPLHHWLPSATPPDLDCPAGAAQQRRTTETGWETWCERGGVKDGPARSFDRAARRESRSTYRDGKLHGPASEIQLRPTLSLAQSQHTSRSELRITDLGELTRASADLATWLPSASPPALACPPGTAQHDEEDADGWTAECRRPDGSVHGPRRVQSRGGTETRTFFENGHPTETRLDLDDGRIVTETTWEKGAQVRKLEWNRRVLALLEGTRGKERVLLRFHPNGTPAQLSRFEGDVRHGEQRSWHDNGQLAEQVDYQAGKERPGGKRFDEQGRLIEIRKLTDGTGTIESIQPGRNDEKTVCEWKGGKRHGTCRTTTKEGAVTYEGGFADGVATGSKTWWENGALRTDWKVDPRTGESKQTNYGSNGKVEQVSVCHRSMCETTRYDDNGNPVPLQPQSRGATSKDEILRSIEDFL